VAEIDIGDDRHARELFLGFDDLRELLCRYLAPDLESTDRNADHFLEARLMDDGLQIAIEFNIRFDADQSVILECTYTGRRSEVACRSLVAVTSRTPNDELGASLAGMPDAVARAGILSVTSIGDCLAPSTIAAAVYAGHRYAREFDRPESDAVGFHRELPILTGEPPL